MPVRAARPCSSPGCHQLAPCPVHQRQVDRQRELVRGTRTQRGYDNAWLRVSAAAIRQQPWCSLCYATSDLTADHLVPISRGGTPTQANARVLCRSCNSRRGNRTP